ncbi:DNA repair protein REV1 isoform X9 [Durio zibethinus]|uniref:DNA repair protein REV1 n=1 Tax=Durio zibethinus TaxID=66656 RepID=A0A6P5Y5U2_DURZI|nr:DNA repair protein REV1 isoform X9 [Durio zibethinus]
MSMDSSRSANSTLQNSKRSFNSNSSSSNSYSKKKKSNQKTLGMAWGANSLSSSRSSFRSSPFSDFGSYMIEKNRKLQNQFDAEASNSSQADSSKKPIFHGVSIFVDGFTVPSSQELRQYMLNYGGRFENYFSRHRVTHIICSNLPDSKIKNRRSFSGGLPVVKPTWVLDSVAGNRLLSWVPYQLEQFANNQPTLSAFFTPKSNPADEVVIRSHPELYDKPVAVCHSDNPKGTAEISSANYPARDYGIRAGMFVRDAKALCPQLIILPYNFEAYEEVADQFYNILHKHCKRVQAVSCDEAFLDVTDLEGKDPQLLASAIRKEICKATGCTASAGIAENMLMARLATRTAKPNGQCYIHPERVDEYLDQLQIKALPGIGHVLEEKLKNKNVRTCGQLRMISKDSLQKDFGIKTGEMLWNYSRGVDNRLVGMIQESKSVGAEVNWGVRFRDLQDTQHFLLDLCKEVSLRLQGCGVQGRTFTLKIKRRRKDAGEPVKYMGCGDCENLSHSTTVPLATDDVEVLQRITKQLFGFFHIDVKDIRGVGLQVSRLESANTARQVLERNSMKSWLTSASASSKERLDINSIAKERVGKDSEVKSMAGNLKSFHFTPVENSVHGTNNTSNGEGCSNQISSVPLLCHLDMGVVESLPSELLSELNEIYGGKLVDLIAKSKGQSENNTGYLCFLPPEPSKVAVEQAEISCNSNPFSLSGTAVEMKDKQHILEELQTVPDSGAESNSVAISIPGLENNDLMPSSLSQVDTSVLQQLPEELRADLFEVLPAHRMQEISALGPNTKNVHHPLGIKTTGNQPGSTDSGLSNNLWIGNPPPWVDKFKVSNSLTLKLFADMYYKAKSAESLSSILQCTVAESLHPLDARCGTWNEAVHSFSELLLEYIKLKIVVDIEEIYICFRLLRRLSNKSEFFLEVYNLVFPHLQASVDEHYGGNLHIPLNK